LIWHEPRYDVINASFFELKKDSDKYFYNDSLIDSVYYYDRLLYKEKIKTMTKNVPSKVYINEVLREICQFYFSITQGYYIRFDSNGNRQMEGVCNEMGYKIGKWIYYKDGLIKKERNYKNQRFWRYVKAVDYD
jgi:wobble nucleotide-excising tRNase